MKSLALRMFLFALIALGFSREARADTCPDGYPNYCGNNLCCPSGYSCGGGCGANCCGTSGSGGGTCPAGYPVDCNNGSCCPSGYTCNGSSCTPSGGGGGICPPGYPIDCNNGGCCPSGYACDGSSCTAGGNGPNTGGGQVVCATIEETGCDSVQACAGDSSSGQNSPQAYYDADGKIFNCDTYSCQSAAEQVVDYCESKSSACSVVNLGDSRSSNGGYGLLAISAAIGLAFVGRRSRRAAGIAAVCVMIVAGAVALSACGPADGDAQSARDEVVFKANLATEAIVAASRANGNIIKVQPVEAAADVEQVPTVSNRGSSGVDQAPMVGDRGALVSR